MLPPCSGTDGTTCAACTAPEANALVQRRSGRTPGQLAEKVGDRYGGVFSRLLRLQRVRAGRVAVPPERPHADVVPAGRHQPEPSFCCHITGWYAGCNRLAENRAEFLTSLPAISRRHRCCDRTHTGRGSGVVRLYRWRDAAEGRPWCPGYQRFAPTSPRLMTVLFQQSDTRRLLKGQQGPWWTPGW